MFNSNHPTSVFQNGIEKCRYPTLRITRTASVQGDRVPSSTSPELWVTKTTVESLCRQNGISVEQKRAAYV